MYLSCDRMFVEVVPYCKSANSARWLHLHANTSDQRVSVCSSWNLYLFQYKHHDGYMAIYMYFTLIFKTRILS